MGKLVMIIATLIIILIVAIRNIYYKKILKGFKILIIEITHYYLGLFKDITRTSIGSILQTALLILAQIFMSFNVISAVSIYINFSSNHLINLIIKIIIIIAMIFMLYLAVGYVLLSSSMIFKLLSKVEDSNIKYDLLISYFVLNTYFTVLIVFPKQFEECYFIGLIGVAICYMMNLRVLIKIIKNPEHINIHLEKYRNFKSTTTLAILILIMMILNLFLAVCFINSADINSYTGNPNNFDLFYYTIITFTTIGYGDIVPVTVLAKIMSIIISTTSVVCITIFLSSVLSFNSEKNK
ncbi:MULTISPECIES: potassium channel family protein [Clostridium]|uniref:Ion channel family protein n=2 Tax=Clostridium butyricum TaxID=1492 RepID=C4IIA5_CLOBU|nr:MULTISPECIES: potassium channel family protein [Clostridium]AXB84734.1 two pore domain potassium channel family protein [Clostridium butyricum]EDT73857.1 Ion channel family [Clostridium butyricum 5521]EEP53136.1 Ion channel family protein [Clostridium butyricum E4 str. BoNT E BL5262]EMU54738.1 ion channel family protein [Clostridium butyricum DKU-01]KIU07634.1 Ion channel family [Clostridium butyricum]